MSADPWALDAKRATFHQMATFVVWPHSLVAAVAASPLFEIRERDDVVRAEWMAASLDEPSAYPLGRITLHSNGVVLDAFSEERIADLQRAVDGLGSWRVTADETRAFSLEDLLANPAAVLHPVEESRGRAPTARDVAVWYLRAGWTFQPNPALNGRAPHIAARTGRGWTQLKGLLPELAARLPEDHSGFPRFDPEELELLLLPGAPAPSPTPDPSRESGASRRV
ncbi:MAG: hypothetical protein DHS20C21_24520 [Gemmatimonadota bacterium]|nr:MAG: hypothetical protein DHS20C21_24520 [Gemmatimonadota bacterium]